MPENISLLARLANGIKISCVSIQQLRNQSIQFNSNSGNSNFNVSFLNNVPWYVTVMHHGITEIIITDDKREISMFPHLFFKILQATVKIMITHSRCFITHFGHELYINLSQEKIEVWRSLEYITRIQEQYM